MTTQTSSAHQSMPLSASPIKVLFVCTHNSCRSIIAEASARHFGQGQLLAASVGSAPSGKVNEDAISLLHKHHVATDHLHSKSWQDVASFDADLIITVCDQAANEACPISQQHAEMVHWGLPDPSRVTDSADQRDAAFDTAFKQIQHLITTILDLASYNRHTAQLAQALRQEAPGYL